MQSSVGGHRPIMYLNNELNKKLYKYKLNMSNLWVEKYRPSKLDELIINNTDLKKIKEWFSNFKESKQKCLLLHGTPGVGKTCIAKILLNQCNYDAVEFNAMKLEIKS